MKNLLRETPACVGKQLPEAGHRVLVICRKFTCLGYLDEKGVWREDGRQGALKDVAAWMELTESVPIKVRETIQLPAIRAGLAFLPLI